MLVLCLRYKEVVQNNLRKHLRKWQKKCEGQQRTSNNTWNIFIRLKFKWTIQSICKGPLKNVTREFIFASPAVSCTSYLSYLGSFWDGKQVAIQLLFCGVLLQAPSIFVSLQSSFFSMRFVGAHMVHPYSSIDTATARKKSRFISSEWSDFTMIYW